MKKSMKLMAFSLAGLMALTGCSSTKQADTNETKAKDTTAFEPKLDTEKSLEITVASFFGNFEALDKVINDFNEFYPNVAITYDQSANNGDSDFLVNNPSIDIFMTSTDKGYPTDSCVDLLEAGVDVSAISDDMLKSNTFDGKLLSLPMGQSLHGVVVNKTLLEKEGLQVPQTWSEFLEVLETLKQKGYTPIQGPDSAFGNLCYDMAMTKLAKDSNLVDAAMKGDEKGASSLQVVYERMQELRDKGYISKEVNAEYPEDNYDGAIMKFFEGNVPFWVSNTENFSGMKKREAKSEAFSANSFDYEFCFAPIGDNGVYKYAKPWYGFAINKDSANRDYAVEFLRFMARADELNALASIKGVPSIAKEATDERYSNLNNIEKIEDSVVFDGSSYDSLGAYLIEATTELIGSDSLTAQDALASFVKKAKAGKTE